MQNCLFFFFSFLIIIDVRSVCVTWSLAWGRNLVYRQSTPALPDQSRRGICWRTLVRSENPWEDWDTGLKPGETKGMPGLVILLPPVLVTPSLPQRPRPDWSTPGLLCWFSPKPPPSKVQVKVTASLQDSRDREFPHIHNRFSCFAA